VDRLRRSTKALGIPFEYEVAELVEAAKETIRVNGLRSCYVRPVTFYGTGSMGLNPAGASVHMVIAAWEWGAYLGEEGIQNGITVAVSSWRRIGQDSFMPDAKGTGGYMNSVLAKTAAIRAGYDEALLLNSDGLIAEGSGENLFMVRNGILHTPPTSAGALDGLTRDSVHTLLTEDGYTSKETQITRTDLYYADEVFFTGTAAEVTPIREIDDREVGDGKPGAVTRRAQELYMGTVKGEITTHPDWLEYV
jgi:branched-chain amino acid aminotransferase